jgi:protein-tyrosine phosphatase
MCRSPLAEAVFIHHARARGFGDRFEVDSAGTWAADGIAPHPASVEIAHRRGIDLRALSTCSRCIVPEDLHRFDHVVAMDRANEADILRLRRISAFGPVHELSRAQVRLLRVIIDPRACGRVADVPDPIGAGPEAYVLAFELIEAGCLALIDELTA